MQHRFAFWGTAVVMAVVLAWLSITGVPHGHPLSGLVTFVRVLVPVLVAVFVLLLVLVPAFRAKVLGRFGGSGGAGLSKEDRQGLSKFERQALAGMGRTGHWAESAGVSQQSKTRKGDPLTLFPRVVSSEVTAQGPAITVHIVMGTVPSQYDDEKISAALSLPIKCEQAGPAQVRIQLLSRDPLSQNRTVAMPVGLPVKKDQDVSGWADIDLSELD